MHRISIPATPAALGLACLLLAPLAFAAPGLLPPAEGDLVAPANLARAAAAAPMLPAADLEPLPVQFAWGLEADARIEPPRSFVAESREYHTELDGAALAKGHALALTAPGAVLRLSPLAGAKATGSAPVEVTLLRGGKPLGPEVLEHAADAAALKAAGADFPEGTIAFRIAAAAGSEGLQLRAAGAEGRWLLHVYEPQSPVVARLAPAADTAFASGTLRAQLSLHAEGRVLEPGSVRALLAAPDGRTVDADVRIGAHGAATVEVALPEALSRVPGLWELHAFVAAKDGTRMLLRDVKTGVSVVAPTAKLGAGTRTRMDDTGLAVSVPLAVATKGRYELRAVLYGHAADGSLQPIASTHAAQWLQRDGAIELSVPKALIDASGLSAPYELRDLQLADQSRLAKLETRARALVIAAPATGAPDRRMQR